MDDLGGLKLQRQGPIPSLLGANLVLQLCDLWHCLGLEHELGLLELEFRVIELVLARKLDIGLLLFRDFFLFERHRLLLLGRRWLRRWWWRRRVAGLGGVPPYAFCGPQVPSRL